MFAFVTIRGPHVARDRIPYYFCFREAFPKTLLNEMIRYGRKMTDRFPVCWVKAAMPDRSDVVVSSHLMY